MNSRSRYAVLLALLLAAAAQAHVELAADVWPPFTDKEGGHRVALDLVEAALGRAGVESQTEIRQDFQTILRDLRSGKLDGGAALWQDEEREDYLLFSRPYLENRLVLLALEGTDVSARSLSELDGKRIALVEGYSYGGMLDITVGPTFVRGPSEQHNFEQLLSGKVDYLLTDELLIHELFEGERERAERELDVGTFPLIQRSLHLAIRRNRDDAAEVIRKFEAALDEMIADGSYNRLLGVAWIEADIDRDGSVELVFWGQRVGEIEPADGYVVFRPDEPEEDEDKPKARRYVIDGRVYESWQQVPPEYRVRERAEAEMPRVPVFTW